MRFILAALAAHRLARRVASTVLPAPVVNLSIATLSIVPLSIAALVAGCAAGPGNLMAESARKTVLVRYADVTIETVMEGAGPAVVLLPSLGRDGYEDYDHTAEALARDGLRVLRPQPRGIGQSTGPMTGVLLPAVAEDIHQVILQQAGGRAVVVGHAYGHFVARTLATIHPESVRGVVVAGASARVIPADIAPMPGIAGNLALPDEERLKALRRGFFAPASDPRPWLKGWYPKTQVMQAASSRGAYKQAEWWAAGRAPLLELIPDSDPFKPRQDWNQLREEFGARVTTVIIPNASHALFPEQPEAVAKAIAAWMRTLPR